MNSTSADSTDRTLVRLLLAVLAVLVLAPLLTMALAGSTMGGMGWWMHDGGTAGVAPWWGFGFGLVWLVALLGVGYVAYRALVGPRQVGDGRDNALEELRLAYARGDLTDEEFESRRAVLTEDRET